MMLEDVGLILNLLKKFSSNIVQHLKSTRDDWHRFHGDLPFYRAKTKMAENEMIVELSVLNPNSIELYPYFVTFINYFLAKLHTQDKST